MKKYIIFLISIVLFSSCSKNRITGEGPSRTEDRTIAVQGGIESIRINGSTNAQIIYGANYKLEVSGYGNLVTALHTDVSNKTLVVEFPDYYNIKNNNTKVILTIPHLPNLYINGSANAVLSGIFDQQSSINFTINGSGKINASNVNSNVDFAKFNISGSGEINAFNLISKSFEGSISGSGEIETSVFNSLKANISGSGKIYYKGNPVVNTDISGSGKVIHAN